jgi:putative SOS response-associated peptidase YedK
MCYHRQQRETIDDVANYYSASYAAVMAEIYSAQFYENGFDYKPGLVLTADKPRELQLYKWGLIPHFATTKDYPKIANTLNCVSENSYTTNAFKDSTKTGKRCLLPSTGFYEWRHVGKVKYPYFICA